MKYITFVMLMLLFCIGTLEAQKTPEQTPENILIKGKISQNSENENNSPDPKFNVSSIASIKIPDIKSATGKRLAEMEKGLQVIEDVVDKIIKQAYTFSLLSQHKYMLDNCIGIKASVGEFSVQFGKPEIKINEVGKVVIKLNVDEIKFDALKIRMRPCPKDLQCHFSERFNIGGLARDLSMTVTMDPTAMIAASTGICAFSFKGPITVHWRIKSLNLKPLQNNLDDVAKQMIEDALNVSSLNIVRDRFISIAKSILPLYFETCETLYTPPDVVKDAVKENASTNKEKTNEEKTDETKENEVGNATEKWVISPSGTKGAAGIVSVNLPAGVEWHLDIKTSADKALGRWDDRWNNTKTINLIPGEYNIFFTYIPLLGVPVQKGMNTRLKAGILNVVTTGQWQIWNEEKTKVHVVYYKPSKIALPIGRYNIQLNGQYQQIEIKEGEVTEF